MSARFAALFSAVAFFSFGCGSDGNHGASSTKVSAPAAAARSDAGEAPAFVLDEGALTLKSGQEGLFCTQMAVPPDYTAGDSYITGLNADISFGTHHMIMTSSDDPAGSTPTLCKDTGSGQVTSGGGSFQDFAVNPSPISVLDTLKRIAFGGGAGSADIRFPKGYGKPMPLGFFESSHHVLNLRADAVDVHARFGVFTAKASDIQFPMGVFFANALDVDLKPMSEGTVEGTMTVPRDVDIVAFMSHAHNFLTKFEMFLYRNGVADAEPIYVSEDWETPRAQVQDPPIQLKAGDGITYRCTYNNTTPQILKWGVTNGEMCMPFAMYAYPEGGIANVPPTMSVATEDTTPTVLTEGSGGFLGH